MRAFDIALFKYNNSCRVRDEVQHGVFWMLNHISVLFLPIF